MRAQQPTPASAVRAAAPRVSRFCSCCSQQTLQTSAGMCVEAGANSVARAQQKWRIACDAKEQTGAQPSNAHLRWSSTRDPSVPQIASFRMGCERTKRRTDGGARPLKGAQTRTRAASPPRAARLTVTPGGVNSCLHTSFSLSESSDPFLSLWTKIRRIARSIDWYPCLSVPQSASERV